MADIFVSYSSQDHDRVEPLVAALEARGWSVWYDQQLAGGQVFSETIEQEINAAKAVIAVWTVTSIKSRWVADEAEIARDANKLVPVTVDGTLPPIGFRQYHEINLAGWTGDQDYSAFRALVSSLSRLCGATDEPELVLPDQQATGDRQRWLAIGVAGLTLVLLAVLLALKFYLPAPATSPAATPVAETGAEQPDRSILDSIAVLPFDNFGEPNKAYFADGLSEELLNRLAKTKGLKVAARTSSFSFRGAKEDVPTIGAALKVKTVLEGSVRWAGDKLRVTAQLIDVKSGYHLWSETYDREMSDVFKIQDDICARIIQALDLELNGSDVEVPANHATDINAYSEYIKGQYLLATASNRNAVEALEHYDAALTIDPDYAPALAGKISAYSMLSYRRQYLSFQNREAMNNAISRLISSALSQHPDNAQILATEGNFLNFQGRFPEGLEKLDRAVALNPNLSDAHLWRGIALSALRRFDEAHKELDLAIELDPLSSALASNYVIFNIGIVPKDQIEQAWQSLLTIVHGPNPMASGLRLTIDNYYGTQHATAEYCQHADSEAEFSHNVCGWAYANLGEAFTPDNHFSSMDQLANATYFNPEYFLNHVDDLSEMVRTDFLSDRFLAAYYAGDLDDSIQRLRAAPELISDPGSPLYANIAHVQSIFATYWILREEGMTSEADTFLKNAKATLDRQLKYHFPYVEPHLWMYAANYAAVTNDPDTMFKYLEKRFENGMMPAYYLRFHWFDPWRDTDRFKAIESRNLKLVNAERAKLGWPPLTVLHG